MIHQTAITILLILLSLGTAHASEGPKAVFSQTTFHFGEVVRGAIVEHEFALKNEGTAPLRILKIRLTEPLAVIPMSALVAPGQQAALRFKLDTSSIKGPFEGLIVVSLNDPTMPEVALKFAGQVVSTIELSPLPAFFVAARRGESKQSSIEIINHEPEPLRIEIVEHATDRFTTKLEAIEGGKRYRLTLMLKPDGPGGKHTDPILVKTSSKTTPLLKIAASTYLRERVYAFPDAVDLGALRLSDIQKSPGLLRRLAQTLMVYQMGGSDFQVKLRTDLPMLDLKWERGPKGDRFQTTVTLIREKLQAGPIKGSIFVETNDPQFPSLTVPVSGSILEGQTSVNNEPREIPDIPRADEASLRTEAANVVLNIASEPSKGDKSAKLALIEFSDYQCSYCALHVRETLPQIEKDYIKTGKLRYVFRDFPSVSIHKQAFKAAEAAHCAGEQGKFWEMHDRLYENQNALGPGELPLHAQALGLQLPKFLECFNSGKYSTEIRKDMEEGGKIGLSGTPIFLLGVPSK